MTDKLQKVPCSSLFEKTHQGTPECLTSVRRDLCNRGFRPITLLNIAASNLFEFEVSGDVGRDENVCEFTVGHEKLGDEVDVPVVGTAIFLPWLGAGRVVAISFEELSRENQLVAM